MSFRPCVAPIKVGIYRLINNPSFDPIIQSIHERYVISSLCLYDLHFDHLVCWIFSLQSFNIAHKVDSSSGTVGKRYARSDELGIPFGVTIDFQTLLDDTVTLRERDSMVSHIVSIDNLILSINNTLYLPGASPHFDRSSRKYHPKSRYRRNLLEFCKIKVSCRPN